AKRARWYSLLCRNDHPRLLREMGLLAAMRGRSRKARRLLDQSLELARRQQAQAEYALTLQARARVGSELDWKSAPADAAEARRRLREQHLQMLAVVDEARIETAHLSLADRFHTIL